MSTASQVMTPPSSAQPTERAKSLLPWLVAVAFFMESLDTTILNTAVPHHFRLTARRCPEHEVGAVELHAQPCGVHSISGWMADRSAPDGYSHRLSDCSPWAPVVRAIAQHQPAGRLPGHTGLRRAMMVPVGVLTLVRTFANPICCAR